MSITLARKYEVKLSDSRNQVTLHLDRNPEPGSYIRYRGKWWLVVSVSWFR